MAKTVADFIWERLQAWNVHRLLAYPGGSAFFTRISPFPGAGDRSQAREPRAHHLVLHASGT
jgi:hypothetical protein